MAIKVGNKEVVNITVGSTPVKSVYKGSTKIWPTDRSEEIWTGDAVYRNTSSSSYPRPGRSGSVYISGGSGIGDSIPAGTFLPGRKYRLYLGSHHSDVRSSQTVDYKKYYWYYHFSSSATTGDYIEVEFPEIPASGNAYNNYNVNIPTIDRTDAYLSQVSTYISSSGVTWLGIGGYYYYEAGYDGDVIAPVLRITKIEQLM